MPDVKIDPKVRLRALTVSPTVGTAGAQLLLHPVVHGVLHILQELLTGNGVRLVPRAGDPVPDAEMELFAAMTEADGWDTALRHLVSAYLMGAACFEIVWGEDYFPVAYRPVPHGKARLGLDEYGVPQDITVQTSVGVQSLPLAHAVLFMPLQTVEHPAGEPRLLRYRKYLDAYDDALKSLHLYIQRHGTPTVLAQLPPSYTEQETQAVHDALVRMQNALVATVPAAGDAKIEFLEPRGTGMELALRLLELLERLVVRSLLGSILAVYEAQYGTRAQAQVHWEVMQQLVASMQRPLERALDAQLWRRLAEYHQGVPAGKLALNEPNVVSREALLRTLGDLAALGVIEPERDREWLRALAGVDA